MTQFAIGAKKIERVVTDKSSCDFYHSIDWPDGTHSAGQWDLRKTADEYLGGVALNGKRVLEIGPASGFLTFHMERAGAQPTCVEPPMERFWDLVPRTDVDFDSVKSRFSDHIERIRNSFWYTHHCFNSTAVLYEADAYDLPESMGRFDVAVLAAILLHCSSPVKMLESVAQRVTGDIVIVDLYHPDLGEGPVCALVPSPDNEVVDSWWRFSPAFFQNYLGVMGFKNSRVLRHSQWYLPGKRQVEFFTLVASRA